MAVSQHFKFDGGAGTYIGTAIGAFFLTLFTLGFGYPWALCMKQRWIAKHTIIDGRRCRFIAHGGSLIGLWIKWLLLLFVTGLWIKWLLLLFVTLGIYSFWIAPNLQKWIVEHTDFED